MMPKKRQRVLREDLETEMDYIDVLLFIVTRAAGVIKKLGTFCKILLCVVGRLPSIWEGT